MQGSKEMFIRMREEEFNTLPRDVRERFTYCEVREVDEYQNNKDDDRYMLLYNRKRKAAKAVQEYLFEKRHK